MKLENITDVFFDLDHTLWDFDRNSALAFEQVFVKHDIALTLPAFQQVYEPINLAYWKQYRDNKISKLELRRGRFRDAFEPFGMRFDEAQLDALAVTYIEELPKNNHLFEGVEETLEYLSERYRLHIITNGFEEVQYIKLKNSKIDHFFRSVTTSEEAGVKKPHPDIFKLALQKTASNPNTSLMIGDSFEADIEGAHAYGMHTLFYNYRKEEFTHPHNTIETISQIMSYL
ncbi:YjjG family noncanonical pyrimidine nucleotidase [Altibacter sp. HG106]|uniref:YjjG family noncanonical pyrimidine nucleotidase n=1 Tax=Altibacter sp. HG106 TaxID=3023937 RepID=UPI0023509068|nr:YjjG family noncanonical pyrimidine nucleotidase [Altibacter sp. HG106]MDC7995975.1 YjjG family noncanonical pyrimidine nucleotidase [Altibacter sp. HG106]